MLIPHVHHGTGGLLHVSGIMAAVAATTASSEKTAEAQLAVEEALEIFTVLNKTLQTHGATAQDVAFVHLYLSKISHFEIINAHYKSFFGTLLPPSRSCVAVGQSALPGGRRVLLDCMIQLGSGNYMRSVANGDNTYAAAAGVTKSSKLREVLHVQSISHWAPICVGPYSQANTIRSGLHFLAGQIGLIPATMTLRSTWQAQLEQCWKNVAAVLDALNGGSLDDICSSLIYVSEVVHDEKNAMERIRTMSNDIINNNACIVPGKIDSLHDTSELYGGYEDEGTWREEMKSKGFSEESARPICPALVVCVPEMPKGAVVEVEVITATSNAAQCLEWKDSQVTSKPSAIFPTLPRHSKWDTGHYFSTSQTVNCHFEINSFVRALGHGGAAVAVATASLPSVAPTSYGIQMDCLLADMLASVEECLADARSGLSKVSIIHVRLFYVSSELCSDGTSFAREDGIQIQASLKGAVASIVPENAPATTAVPVIAIDSYGPKFGTRKQSEDNNVQLAMQILVIDPVHLETDIWIHKDREYAT